MEYLNSFLNIIFHTRNKLSLWYDAEKRDQKSKIKTQVNGRKYYACNKRYLKN